MKLQTNDNNYKKDQITSTGNYLVSVDDDSNDFDTSTKKLVAEDGVLNGVSGGGNSKIQVQQGLDTSDISSTFIIDPDLNETQFILEIDNRLGMISHGGTTAAVSFIDDDNLASYFLSSNPYVEISEGAGKDTAIDVLADTYSMAIAGPRGNVLEFQIKASLDLNSSTALFTKLGSTYLINGTSFYYIDTTVRVTGATTGYRLDIPVRFVKKV